MYEISLFIFMIRYNHVPNLKYDFRSSGITPFKHNLMLNEVDLNANYAHYLSKLLAQRYRGAKTRRRIIQALRFNPKNCNQISKELRVDWWTVHKHLKLLERAGIIKSISFGRIKFYKFTTKITT